MRHVRQPFQDIAGCFSGTGRCRSGLHLRRHDDRPCAAEVRQRDVERGRPAPGELQHRRDFPNVAVGIDRDLDPGHTSHTVFHFRKASHPIPWLRLAISSDLCLEVDLCLKDPAPVDTSRSGKVCAAVTARLERGYQTRGSDRIELVPVTRSRRCEEDARGAAGTGGP